VGYNYRQDSVWWMVLFTIAVLHTLQITKNKTFFSLHCIHQSLFRSRYHQWRFFSFCAHVVSRWLTLHNWPVNLIRAPPLLRLLCRTQISIELGSPSCLPYNLFARIEHKTPFPAVKQLCAYSMLRERAYRPVAYKRPLFIRLSRSHCVTKAVHDKRCIGKFPDQLKKEMLT
jgi:hypothetical protein